MSKSTLDFKELEMEIPHLRRFARSLLGDEDRADDLVQDALERAIARQEMFQPDTNLRAWLFTIMRNLHVDSRRKAARRGEEVPLDEQTVPLVTPPNQIKNIELQELQYHVDQLPRKDRAMLLMIGVQGQSYQAVAEYLKMPIGTVRSRLSRVRSKLRARLEKSKPSRRQRKRMQRAQRRGLEPVTG